MPKRPKSVKVKLEGLEAKASVGEPVVRLYSHLPENHQHYTLVGRVASEWSHLEHTLDHIIWELASFRVGGLGANVVACITSQVMGVGPRCKVIASLAATYLLHNEKLRKQINRVKSRSYLVADERARAIHDPWWIETESKTPAQFRAMPSSDPYYGFKDISKEQVEETITCIKSLQNEAAILRDLVRSELAALRERLAPETS